MKLTRADFKDALKDARFDLECGIADAARERKHEGKPQDYTQYGIIIESAKVAALRYYLKHTKEPAP